MSSCSCHYGLNADPLGNAAIEAARPSINVSKGHYLIDELSESLPGIDRGGSREMIHRTLDFTQSR